MPKGKPTEFHYYDWNFHRWFGSETRARCRALEGEYPHGLLALAAQGAYRELIDYCSKDGDIPADMPGIAALCGCSVEVVEMFWPLLKSKFQAHKKDSNRLVNNDVLTRRRAWKIKRKQNSDAGTKSAISRGLKTTNGHNDLGNDRSTPVEHTLNQRNKQQATSNKQQEESNKQQRILPRRFDPHDETFLEFVNAADEYGMKISDEEWFDTERFYWSKENHEQRLEHIKGIRDRIVAGDMSLVPVIPKNYIEKRLCKRTVRNGHFPKPKQPETDQIPKAVIPKEYLDRAMREGKNG